MIRVALTRAAGGNDELARRLTDAGLEPVECPLIAVEPLPGPPLDLDPYDWLVLTSRHGVEALAARGWTGEARVAAIGPGTAAAAREHGLEPALVPDVSTQEGLVAAFPADPGRVLFAGAEDARDHLARELGADVVVLYRTVPLRLDAVPTGRAGRARVRLGRAGLRCARAADSGRVDRPGHLRGRARGRADGARGGRGARSGRSRASG